MEKQKLTEDIRRELLGLVPFAAGSADEYTPPQFLKQSAEGHYVIPEQFRPVFKIRCLSVEEKRSIAKFMQNLKDVPEDQMFEAARSVVVGWRNLYEAGNNSEVAFKAGPDGGADKDLFGTLPPSIIGALLFHSCRISGVVSAERLGLK